VISQVRQEQPTTSVRALCRLLGINRAWYYAAQRRPPPPPDETATALRAAIEEIILEFPGYGYRRVTKALARAGWAVNHKRVWRVMQQEALLCHLKRAWVPTTDSRHSLRRYPNLLKAEPATHINAAFVADITYIRLPSQFIYLASLLDSYSRRCVGWALGDALSADLPLAALEMALGRRAVQPGWIHHSDQGVQYASSTYIERLEQAGARISMAAPGCPYENAQAERFFRTLKYEEVYLKHYRTFAEAETNLREFIETVYNTKRLHSSLGYVPPSEFEAALAPAVRM
jgi:transposase InsO family protein